MKKIVLFLLITSSIMAQNEPIFSFVNKENNTGYGGTMNSFKSTKDNNGNTYLVGSFTNIADFDPSTAEANLSAINGEFGDMFIAKYDANGGFVWAKNMGGTGYVNCTGIAIGGNFMYLVGKYTNTIDFDPSNNTANQTSGNGSNEAGFMAKYDLNGFYVMSKSIDANPDLTLNSIHFNNNQLVISGHFSGTVDFDPSVNTLNLVANGGTDIFLAKYNASYVPQWGYNFGDLGNDTSFSSAIDSAGNIIVTGNYINTVDFDPSATTNTITNSSTTVNNTYIAKYTTAGSFVWVKDIGAKVSNLLTSNAKLAVDANNNIIVSGTFTISSDFDPSATVAFLSTTTTGSTFIAKYDTNGTYAWAKKLTLCVNKDIVLSNTSNNIVVFGTFSSTSDFDPGTAVLNLNTANGLNYFASYDSSGNLIYAKNIKATIASMHANDTDGVFLSGTFSGTSDVDPSAVTVNLYSSLTNVFLGKYDNTGAYIAALAIGGNKPTNAVGNSIATDGQGNIYRAGVLSAGTDLDPSASTFTVSSTAAPGIFIAKYTSTGNLVWGKTISGGTTLTLSVMNTDIYGNTYILGRLLGTVDFDPSGNSATLTNESGLLSMYMAKYDSNGNYLWAKQLTGSFGAFKRMVFDTTGNFYITGILSGTDPIDFDPSPTVASYLTLTGSIETFFAKYSPQGDYIWAKNIIGVDTNSAMNPTHIELKGNSLYVTGLFFGGFIFNAVTNEVIGAGTSSLTGFVAKYDLDGNYQFAADLINNDPNASAESICEAITVDDNNNMYVISNFSGTIDFDLSTTSEYNAASLTDVNQNPLRSYAISKYSPTGTFIWTKVLNSLDLNSFVGFKTMHAYITNNELMISNIFGGNVDFDPSTNDSILTTAIDPSLGANTAIFVAKYNLESGDFIWANKIDPNKSSTLNSTCLDSNQNFLISGSFAGTADFDFSTGVQNVTSASLYNSDRFWAKYSPNPLGLGENNLTKGYRIYPNPTHSQLNVSHDVYEEFTVTIMDITGKILKTTTLLNTKAVDVASYPQGMYFIQIENGRDKNTYKFMKN